MALAQVGQTISRELGAVVEEFKRRDDESAVFEARRQLNDWESQKIFDPEQGAIARRGRDAFDLPKTLPEDFDKFAGQVVAGLKGQRQRDAFQKMAESRREQVTSWANRHALGQREVYEEGQYQADLKSFADRAVFYSDDPAKIGTELALQNARTVGYLRGKGQSEEVIAQAVKENASRVHTSVIASLVESGEAAKAQEYLTKNAASMGADDVKRVRQSLHEGLARERAQSFGDEMDQSGKTLKEQQDEARKRFKGIEETAALQEINARESQRRVAEAQAAKAIESEVWKVVGNGGGRKQIPVGLWNSLDGQEQTKVNEFIRARQKRAVAEAEGKDATDMGTYYRLLRQSVDKPEEFANEDLMRYGPLLKDADLKSFMAAQTSIRSGGRTLAKDLQDARRTAHSMLGKSMLGAVQPDLAEEASYRFAHDLQAKIERYTTEGKDVRLLLTPGSQEYVLSPERVASYLLQTPQQAVTRQADAIKNSRKASGVIAPAVAASQAEYDALPKGALYVLPGETAPRQKQ